MEPTTQPTLNGKRKIEPEILQLEETTKISKTMPKQFFNTATQMFITEEIVDDNQATLESYIPASETVKILEYLKNESKMTLKQICSRLYDSPLYELILKHPILSFFQNIFSKSTTESNGLWNTKENTTSMLNVIWWTILENNWLTFQDLQSLRKSCKLFRDLCFPVYILTMLNVKDEPNPIVYRFNQCQTHQISFEIDLESKKIDLNVPNPLHFRAVEVSIANKKVDLQNWIPSIFDPRIIELHVSDSVQRLNILNAQPIQNGLGFSSILIHSKVPHLRLNLIEPFFLKISQPSLITTFHLEFTNNVSPFTQWKEFVNLKRLNLIIRIGGLRMFDLSACTMLEDLDCLYSANFVLQDSNNWITSIKIPSNLKSLSCWPRKYGNYSILFEKTQHLLEYCNVNSRGIPPDKLQEFILLCPNLKMLEYDSIFNVRPKSDLLDKFTVAALLFPFQDLKIHPELKVDLYNVGCLVPNQRINMKFDVGLTLGTFLMMDGQFEIVDLSMRIRIYNGIEDLSNEDHKFWSFLGTIFSQDKITKSKQIGAIYSQKAFVTILEFNFKHKDPKAVLILRFFNQRNDTIINSIGSYLTSNIGSKNYESFIEISKTILNWSFDEILGVVRLEGDERDPQNNQFIAVSQLCGLLYKLSEWDKIYSLKMATVIEPIIHITIPIKLAHLKCSCQRKLSELFIKAKNYIFIHLSEDLYLVEFVLKVGLFPNDSDALAEHISNLNKKTHTTEKTIGAYIFLLLFTSLINPLKLVDNLVSLNLETIFETKILHIDSFWSFIATFLTLGYKHLDSPTFRNYTTLDPFFSDFESFMIATNHTTTYSKLKDELPFEK